MLVTALAEKTQTVEPWAIISLSLDRSIDALLANPAGASLQFLRLSPCSAYPGTAVYLVAAPIEDQHPTQAVAERLWQRTEWLKSCTMLGDVIPIRYMQPDSIGQLMRWTETSAAAIGRALGRIQGGCQVDVRWVVDPPVSDSDTAERCYTSGINYLRQRGQTLAGESQLQHNLAGPAAEVVSCVIGHRDTKTAPPRRLSREQLGLSGAGQCVVVGLDLLIDKQHVPAAQKALESLTLNGQPPQAISGPWPAFSFLD